MLASGLLSSPARLPNTSGNDEFPLDTALLSITSTAYSRPSRLPQSMSRGRRSSARRSPATLLSPSPNRRDSLFWTAFSLIMWVILRAVAVRTEFRPSLSPCLVHPPVCPREELIYTLSSFLGFLRESRRCCNEVADADDKSLSEGRASCQLALNDRPRTRVELLPRRLQRQTS